MSLEIVKLEFKSQYWYKFIIKIASVTEKLVLYQFHIGVEPVCLRCTIITVPVAKKESLFWYICVCIEILYRYIFFQYFQVLMLKSLNVAFRQK